MLRTKSFLILILVSLFQSTVLADEFASFFKEFYYSNFYQERYCGQNVMNFIKEGTKHGLQFDDVHILHLRSEGFVHLEGMKGYSARNQGYGRKVPGETMWYFHVILERGGWIYDFDFMNEPTITKADPYFKTMFYPDGFPAGRYEAKLGFADEVKKGYEVQVITAGEYLKSVANSNYEPKTKDKLRLGAYLQKLAGDHSINHPMSLESISEIWAIPMGSAKIKPGSCSDLASPP